MRSLMLNFDAAIHDNADACRIGTIGGFCMYDAQLHPDKFGFKSNGHSNGGGHPVNTLKNVNNINGARNVS